MGIDFFQVYETNFHPDFIKGELSTGLKEMFLSSLSEISTGFYIKLSIILPVILPVSLYIMYKKNRYISDIPFRKQDLPVKIKVFFPPFILLILFSLSASSGMETNFDYIVHKKNIKNSRELKAKLKMLSINPIYALMIEESQKEQVNLTQIKTDGKVNNLSHRLNTNSLLSKNKTPYINNIPRGKKYNIILYFFESTANSYINKQVNGKYLTPTWRRLRKNSFNAMNHYANFPLSANAMFSVLTSAYDIHKKELVIQKYPGIKIKTIPEILKVHGYRTCLIHSGGLLYVGQRKFLKNRKIDKIIEYKDLIRMKHNYKQVGYGIDERAMIKPGIDFIKKSAGEPFFLAFFPVNPHHPYASPGKKFKIFGTDKSVKNKKQKRWFKYANSLHFADHALGELIDNLEKEKLLDNTLVFIFADHGQAFYQHRGNYNHRHFIYEENVHVPFLIYSKQFFKEPVYYNGITRHIDILPTIIDLLGIQSNEKFEGLSILEPHREQLALLHTFWKDDYLGIRDGEWKYILREKDKLEELYNLTDDPGENNNLAYDNKKLVHKFRNYIYSSQEYKKKYFREVFRR